MIATQTHKAKRNLLSYLYAQTKKQAYKINPQRRVNNANDEKLS